MHTRKLILAIVMLIQASKIIESLVVLPAYPLDLGVWLRAVYPPWNRLTTGPPYQLFCCSVAPYGLLWYLLYSPGLLGAFSLVISIVAGESLALLLVLEKQHYQAALGYSMLTGLIFYWNIFDNWLYIFLLLSIRWRWTLWLVPLTKLPILAPLWVWEYVLSVSVPGIGNYPHYVLIGGFFMILLFHNYVRPIRIGHRIV